MGWHAKARGRGDAPFPLTPTLSLGERANRSRPTDTAPALEPSRRLDDESPLPWGEGQGEGEVGLLPLHARDESRNGRTARVHRRSRRLPKTTMTKSLEDRVALVTGGAAGIGAAIV